MTTLGMSLILMVTMMIFSYGTLGYSTIHESENQSFWGALARHWVPKPESQGPGPGCAALKSRVLKPGQARAKPFPMALARPGG